MQDQYIVLYCVFMCCAQTCNKVANFPKLQPGRSHLVSLWGKKMAYDFVVISEFSEITNFKKSYLKMCSLDVKFLASI